MLLIVTERGDLTVDWLILELERRGAPFVRFNTEDYPTLATLAWTPRGAELTISGTRYALSAFDAVWYRRPVAPQLPESLSDAQRSWATREASEALLGAWRTLDARWVNHPDRNRLAESKPEQLRTAARLGFDIPNTLVTNAPEDAQRFIAEHPAGTICKPLWDGRVPTPNGEEQLFFTSTVDAEALDVRALGPEPYLFQALVAKKVDVRVTVIGTNVFAAAIDSQGSSETQIDWRRSSAGTLPHKVEELPKSVANRCLELCKHYQLQFAAIDLARRPDGGYTFFEINPNGQWAWIEQRTGLPLRSRLTDLLLADSAAGKPSERWIERVRSRLHEGSRGRALFDAAFLPLDPPGQFTEPHSQLVARLTPRDSSGAVDAARTHDILAEAQAIYASADERIDGVERRATTLLSAVAIATSLLLAGGALLADPTKVHGAGWRSALAACLTVTVISLAMAGARALGAMARIHVIHRPTSTLILDRTGTPATEARIDLAAETLKDFGFNTQVAAWKVAYLGAAAWWFRWALAALLTLTVALGVYAVFGSQDGNTSSTGARSEGTPTPTGTPTPESPNALGFA